MRYRYAHMRRWWLVGLLVLAGLTALKDPLCAEPSAASVPGQAHHHLRVELMPQAQRLVGIDAIDLAGEIPSEMVFILAERARINAVIVDTQPAAYEFARGRLVVSTGPDRPGQKARIEIHYEARFDDAVPRQPANMDNPGFGVSATISEQGTLLLAGAHWYPHVDARHVTYHLEVRAPRGTLAITSGRSAGHLHEDAQTLSRWQIDFPTDGLALSAAEYKVRERDVNGLRLATYFLEDDEALSERYLTASARYIELYSHLFGPYPFADWAVVENFFPTGYGFPSYTLLGSTVLRLPFIIHTSLGHEIAHCWWGNGVYVDYTQGNWSEGLTTYVADYLYKERQAPAAARDYRRQALRNYAALVDSHKEIALEAFFSRRDPLTKAVGYDKAAMFFHMLRQRVGDDDFWQGLRELYRTQRFRPTSWETIRAVFEAQSGQALQTFFDQWVRRPGAPQLALDAIHTVSGADHWIITGAIVQSGALYEGRADIVALTPQGEVRQSIRLNGRRTAFTIQTDSKPQRLEFDREYHFFRRLAPQELPPTVNSLKRSPSLLIVEAASAPSNLREQATRLVRGLGVRQYRFVKEAELSSQDFAKHDIVLGGLPARGDLLRHLPSELDLAANAFTLNGQRYDNPADAFWGVFQHPADAQRVLALFLPLSNAYAKRTAGKVTHYGRYSYLAFSQGRNMEKGTWPIINSPLVFRWPSALSGERPHGGTHGKD